MIKELTRKVAIKSLFGCILCILFGLAFIFTQLETVIAMIDPAFAYNRWYRGPIEDKGTVLFFFGLGVFMTLTGVVMLILYITGAPLRSVKKHCEESPNQEMTKKKIDELYHSVRPIGGIRVSEDYILVEGSWVQFYEVKDILWIYHHIRHTPLRKIKTYQLVINLANGAVKEIRVDSEGKCEALLDLIAAKIPFIYVGYSNQLEDIYKNNRQMMIREVEKRKYAIPR